MASLMVPLQYRKMRFHMSVIWGKTMGRALVDSVQDLRLRGVGQPEKVTYDAPR